MESSTAMVIVGSAAGYKLLELVLGYFFKKVARDDYVTKASCEQCEKSDDVVIARLTNEISTIKGILLVLAVKQGIPPEQLSKLTR